MVHFRKVNLAKSRADAIRIAKAAVAAGKAEKHVFGLANNVDLLVMGDWYRLWEEDSISTNSYVLAHHLGNRLVYG